MSKERELYLWMRSKGIFASHDVIRWGVEHFYLRADRTKRDFLKDGVIRKLTDQEKAFNGFTCKDAVYHFEDEQIQSKPAQEKQLAFAM